MAKPSLCCPSSAWTRADDEVSTADLRSLVEHPSMRRSLLFSLAALTLCLSARPALASDPIQFARTPDISPDGKTIAFSYLGDVYTVETIGGTARAVTSHPAHDVGPSFSPDGS